MSSLKKKAKKELLKLGLNESSNSDSSDSYESQLVSTSEDEDIIEDNKCTKNYLKKNKKHNHNKRSGINAKSSDYVVNEQRYPHSKSFPSNAEINYHT